MSNDLLEDVCLDCCDFILPNKILTTCDKCPVNFLKRYAKTIIELNQTRKKSDRI
ncbi:MAG: hypothetical protein ACTSPD_10225 [Promethearchaeota archaeon]